MYILHAKDAVTPRVKTPGIDAPITACVCKSWYVRLDVIQEKISHYTRVIDSNYYSKLLNLPYVDIHIYTLLPRHTADAVTLVVDPFSV